MQFIALGGGIGTSLFLGIGSSLAKAGPLSLLLGFTITGLAVYAMVVQIHLWNGFLLKDFKDAVPRRDDNVAPRPRSHSTILRKIR